MFGIGKKATDDDLDEKLDRLKLENQVANEELSLEQRRILIKQLKNKYGSNWKSILRLGRDSESLRQFSSSRFKIK